MKRTIKLQSDATPEMLKASPDLYEACEAADRCISDFLDVYGRDCSLVVLDQAVISLRDDALRLVKLALKKAKPKTEISSDSEVRTQ